MNKENIYDALHEDHKTIKTLLDKIVTLGNEESSEKTSLFNQLKKSIIFHSKAEEKVFYQPLKKYPQAKDKVEHGKEEHEEAEKLLSELTSSEQTLAGAAWQQKLLSLQNALEHHIKEEENEIFKSAKNCLGEKQEQQMAIELKEAKAELEKDKKIELREER